jgi:ribosome recycling factor
MNPILKEAESRMKQAIEATLHDFQRVRTGRANPVILESVMVNYYGVDTPINQVASISIPEPRQILISPYEKNLTPEIERAILKSDIGVSPTNDGTGIRLNFPPMTEERRKELQKQVASRTEEGVVAIRNVRRDANQKLAQQEKDKEITEDERKGLEKKVQDITDKHVAEMHAVGEKKAAELMEI